MAAVIVKKPSDCSAEELAAFKQLVLAGGEVGKVGLEVLIKAAICLVFHYTENQELAGIGALKAPRNSYKDKVFKRAKSSENAADFPYELGWLFVVEKFRGQGLSRELAEAALKLAGGKGVYATTRVDNCPMCRTNTRLEFKRSGEPYRTTRYGRSDWLSLFVRRGDETRLGG